MFINKSIACNWVTTFHIHSTCLLFAIFPFIWLRRCRWKVVGFVCYDVCTFQALVFKLKSFFSKAGVSAFLCTFGPHQSTVKLSFLVPSSFASTMFSQGFLLFYATIEYKFIKVCHTRVFIFMHKIGYFLRPSCFRLITIERDITMFLTSKQGKRLVRYGDLCWRNIDTNVSAIDVKKSLIQSSPLHFSTLG